MSKCCPNIKKCALINVKMLPKHQISQPDFWQIMGKIFGSFHIVSKNRNPGNKVISKNMCFWQLSNHLKKIYTQKHGDF